MPNVFTQWAEHYGGHGVGEFEQTNYLQQFPVELRGGCCMTLCCCYIGSGGDIDVFKSLVNSKIGKAKVRGFQGLATKASGPASELGGYFVGYILEVYRTMSIRTKGEFSMGIRRDPAQVARFVANRPAFYQLHFKEPEPGASGHAIAFQNTGNGLELFDPNYGLVRFSGTQQLGQLSFMLTKLLRDFYPNLGGKWESVRSYYP